LIDHLRTTLHTFANNYQAVMRHLRECKLNDEQLGYIVGLSPDAIRGRRNKPDIWKLSDIERLASHFSLPVTACVQLSQALDALPAYLKTQSSRERRHAERLLLIKMAKWELYNRTDWTVRYLLQMHQALLSSARD
jgi:hypothetical protein